MVDLELLANTQAFLLAHGRLYFDGYNTKEPPQLKQFYSDLESLSNRYNTIPEINNYYHSRTDMGCLRSLRDRFLLCNYYTNCTLADFLTVAYECGAVGHHCRSTGLFILCTKADHHNYRLYSTTVHQPELNNLTPAELFAAAGFIVKEG